MALAGGGKVEYINDGEMPNVNITTAEGYYLHQSAHKDYIDTHIHATTKGVFADSADPCGLMGNTFDSDTDPVKKNDFDFEGNRTSMTIN